MTAVRTARGATSTTSTTSVVAECLLAFLVICFVGLLTLEWITLSGVADGFLKPFHVGIVAVAGVAFSRWTPVRVVGPALQRHGQVYLAYFFHVAISLAGGLAHPVPYFPRIGAIRQLSYAAASLVLCGVVLRIVRIPRVHRILAWAGVVTCLVVTIGLGLALASQNVNPISLVREALQKADPDLISNQLLRDAFRTGEGLEEAGANLRHKVFLGVATGTFLGLAFLPAVPRSRVALRALFVAAGICGSGLVVLSLSRSTILVLVVPFVLAPVRILVRGRATTKQSIAVAVVALALAALLVSPVADLLLARFEETGSLESRLEGAGPIFLSLADDAALAGIAKPAQGSSPHNLVLDAWLSGGVLASLAAVVLLVHLARIWLRVAGEYLGGADRWVLPVAPVWLLGIGGLPLIRAFTAGNQFHMVEWTAIGLFLGIVSANDRLASASATQEAAP